MIRSSIQIVDQVEQDNVTIQKTLDNFDTYVNVVIRIIDWRLTESSTENIDIFEQSILLYAATIRFLAVSLKFVCEHPIKSWTKTLFEMSEVPESQKSLEDTFAKARDALDRAATGIIVNSNQRSLDQEMFDGISRITFRKRHRRLQLSQTKGTGD